LSRLKIALENWWAGTEITTVEVSVARPAADSRQNPWLATAGIFADDPALEPMLREIYAARVADAFRNEGWRNMATITGRANDSSGGVTTKQCLFQTKR
jgi:hypothetical protein